MILLNPEEINTIIKQYGNYKVLDTTISNYSDTLIGYLGEHLKLIIRVEDDGIENKEYKFFVKCMPKDRWLAEFLIESNFFCKEYVMLSDLFVQFDRHAGNKWRPKSLLIRDDLFVFEDTRISGYEMARHNETLSYEEMKAVVKTLAQFHAQSFIFEENKSVGLQRAYTIWEDFNKYLTESKDHRWRNTGRNAVIEFLKVNSKRRLEANFPENITKLMCSLFNDALNLIKPSSKYRNTVVHRDLWSNNILLKKDQEKHHALIIDFQTVLYCPPTMDLSSLIYFNSTKDFRHRYINEILDYYYDELAKDVEDKVDVDFSTILSKSDFIESYDESVVFGITQASIIVPITAMSVKKREELFCDPDSIHKINNVTRSQEIIDVANEDVTYCSRITELFEEIVDRYYDNMKIHGRVVHYLILVGTKFAYNMTQS